MASKLKPLTQDSTLPDVIEHVTQLREQVAWSHMFIGIAILGLFLVLWFWAVRCDSRLTFLENEVFLLRTTSKIEETKPVAAEAASKEAVERPEASAEEFVNGPRNVFTAAVGGPDPFESFRGEVYDDETLAKSL